MVSNGGWRYYGLGAQVPIALLQYAEHGERLLTISNRFGSDTGLYTHRLPEVLVRAWENRSWPAEAWDAVDAAFRLGGLGAALKAAPR